LLLLGASAACLLRAPAAFPFFGFLFFEVDAFFFPLAGAVTVLGSLKPAIGR